MRALFYELIWPAVAGNVAWSFFTLTLQTDWSKEAAIKNTTPKLAALLLVAIYLGIDWLRMRVETDQVKKIYWFFEALFLLSVIIFSIATYLEKPWEWLEWSLCGVFVASFLGHITGAWDPAGARSSRCRRNLLALVHATGVIIITIGKTIVPTSAGWSLPIAIGVVLFAWWTMRNVVFPKLKIK